MLKRRLRLRLVAAGHSFCEVSAHAVPVPITPTPSAPSPGALTPRRNARRRMPMPISSPRSYTLTTKPATVAPVGTRSRQSNFQVRFPTWDTSTRADKDGILVTPLSPGGVAGATTTRLYGLDAAKDVLVTQGSLPCRMPVVSPNTGQLFTVGRLGIDITAVNGFDTSPGASSPPAALRPRLVVGGVITDLGRRS